MIRMSLKGLWVLVCSVLLGQTEDMSYHDYHKMIEQTRAQAITLGYVNYRNNIVVKAAINRRGPYNFILDTGASITLVSPELAAKLKVTRTGKTVRVTGVGGKPMRAEIAYLREVSLNGARVFNLKVVIRAIPDLNDASIVGLLGQDFFNNFIMRLNPEDQSITLSPRPSNKSKPDPFEAQFKEVLNKPGRLFDDYTSLNAEARRIYRIYLGMASEERNYKAEKELDALADRFPVIRQKMEKLYTASLNVPHNHLAPDQRNNLQKFLYCYPVYSENVRDTENFADGLRRALRRSDEPQWSELQKPVLEAQWARIETAERNFFNCH